MPLCVVAILVSSCGLQKRGPEHGNQAESLSYSSFSANSINWSVLLCLDKLSPISRAVICNNLVRLAGLGQGLWSTCWCNHQGKWMSQEYTLTVAQRWTSNLAPHFHSGILVFKTLIPQCLVVQGKKNYFKCRMTIFFLLSSHLKPLAHLDSWRSGGKESWVGEEGQSSWIKKPIIRWHPRH